MLRGFISISRLLILGVVIALVIAACGGGNWTVRPGQTTTISGPKPATATVAQPADTLDLGRVQHEGTPPQVGDTCPTGYDVKAAVIVHGAEQMYVMPGNSVYDSTKPVKCFASAEDAASSGYVAYK